MAVFLLLLCLPSDSLALLVGRVAAGPLQVSEMGCGTWSWGNRLLFDYNPEQDEEIYEAYKMIRQAGVTLFDTGKYSSYCSSHLALTFYKY